MIFGYDVSSNNPTFASWPMAGIDFVVVKASQGTSYRNPYRFAQAAWARSHGAHAAAYHWLDPLADAHAQVANFLAAINGPEGSMGPLIFWAPDIEDPHAASDAVWAGVVNDFNRGAEAVLGARDYQYVSQFFHAAVILPIAKPRGWWDPDYGNNDGNIHPVSNGAVPSIHQFSSAGGIDRNVVIDEARYHALAGDPVPSPHPQEIPNVFVYHIANGTGYIVLDPGKTKLASGTEYRNFVAAGVRDAGLVSDATDALIKPAVDPKV